MMLRHENASADSGWINDDDSQDEEQVSIWKSVKRYLYDPQKKTFCARNVRQWIMMLCYYVGYLVFIVSLYLGFLYGCSSIIKYTYPDYPIVDKESLLETAIPGLGFVPNIVMTKYPIIWYSPDPLEQRDEHDYIKALDKFFKKYKKAKRDDYNDCEGGKKHGKPCFFDLEKLKDCHLDRYQYTNESLCFFLKMNKLRHWTPLYYKKDMDFPDEMSQSMMDLITQSTHKNLLFVECLGRNLWDNEHLGEMTYFPHQGFDGFYFPYAGEPNYLPPLVGIKLNKVKTGVVIHIKCTVWARNIGQRLNHIHLKVFIDNTLPY